MSSLDSQVGGAHYKNRGMQPVVFITANRLDFYCANILKYLTRHNEKNGSQDIEKTVHYVALREDTLKMDQAIANGARFWFKVGHYLRDLGIRLMAPTDGGGVVPMKVFIEMNNFRSFKQMVALYALEDYYTGKVGPEELTRALEDYLVHIRCKEQWEQQQGPARMERFPVGYVADEREAERKLARQGRL